MKTLLQKKPGLWTRPLLWVMVALFSASCFDSSDDPWVVNADIDGVKETAVYVAGYVSGCGCEQGGFIKKRINGRFETVYESTAELWGIWVGGDDAIAAVGSWGAVVTYDGQWNETDVGSGTESLQAIWGAGLDALFAVGHTGAIFHFDGDAWTKMTAPTQRSLQAIWGTAANNVYAVGEAGTILHFDGTAWTAMESNTAEDLNDIWGPSENTVYAVGGSETTGRRIILRLEDGGWVEETSSEGFHLLGIHGASETEIFAVGAKRSGDNTTAGMLRFDGTKWSEHAPGIHQFLWDVYAVGDDSCIVVGPDDTLKQVR